MKRLIIAGCFLCISHACTSAEVPFERKALSEVSGRDICEIHLDNSTSRFGIYLKDKSHHALVYRAKGNLKVVFLVSGSAEPSRCGTITSWLDISDAREAEFVAFKCHEDSVGPVPWGTIIGLVDNKEGRVRYVAPSVAWHVDVNTEKFLSLKGGVTCDTSGYDVGDGKY